MATSSITRDWYKDTRPNPCHCNCVEGGDRANFGDVVTVLYGVYFLNRFLWLVKTVIRKLCPTKSEELGRTDYILMICRQETTSPYLAKPDMRLVVETAGHS